VNKIQGDNWGDIWGDICPAIFAIVYKRDYRSRLSLYRTMNAPWLKRGGAGVVVASKYPPMDNNSLATFAYMFDPVIQVETRVTELMHTYAEQVEGKNNCFCIKRLCNEARPDLQSRPPVRHPNESN